MSMLLAWVLAASSTLAPGRAHDRLAEAIVTRVEAEAPLFKDDEDRRKTSALLVAIAFRESSLRADAVGDFQGSHPTSFCAFQLHVFASRTREGWNGQDLIDDPDKCVFVAMRFLRASMAACPTYPIAMYAAGPNGCRLPRAQRISADRVALAKRLVRDVPMPKEPAPVPLEPMDERSPTVEVPTVAPSAWAWPRRARGQAGQLATPFALVWPVRAAATATN